MTGPPSPPPDPGRAGRPPSGDRVAVGRALVLLAVALVVGIVLMGFAGRPPVLGGSPTAATSETTTTTTSGASTTTTAPRATTTTHAGTRGTGTSTTTTTAAVPRSSVKVLVANGTSVPGAALHFSQILSGQGWTTQPPADTTTPVSVSGVYYAAGQQAAATTIAVSLGLSASATQPLVSTVPVSGTTGVAVVVIVGQDLASQVGGTPTTTTTAAPKTTTTTARTTTTTARTH